MEGAVLKPGRFQVSAAGAREAGRSFLFAAAMALLLSVGGCILGTAKRGSEVENPEAYGIVVDGSGQTVRGARVRAVAAAGFPLPTLPGGTESITADSAVTDSAGGFRFQNLPAGQYNFIADQDPGSQVALIPQVTLAEGYKKQDLGVATLREPGSIRGRVTLGGAGKEGALAFLPGTTYLAFSDANGEFLATGVPQGTYAVNYLVTGFQAAPDSGVQVLAGKVTSLPDKELGYDTSLAPPAPSRVRVTFDTVTSVARVEWSAIRVADLLGYLVYRDSGLFTSPELRTTGIVTDTVFLDTLTKLAKLKPPPTLTYRIVSVDRNKDRSLGFSPPAQAFLADPALATTTLVMRRLDGHRHRIGIGDTARIEITYANPGRKIRQVAWWTKGSTVPVRVRADSSHAGADTLALAWTVTGMQWVAVVVSDAVGPTPTHILEVEVVQDPPVAEAGDDRDAFAGDTLRIVGRARQEFGTIVRYEWDVGATGVFQASAQGGADVAVPKTPGARLSCVLRVVDDDGNEDLDTVTITAVLDPPAADAGADREASASDTLRLEGSATDRLGAITLWEWDMGGTGRFEAGPADRETVTPPVSAGRWPCILRVTDDDGQVDLDTVLVQIVPDAPVPAIDANPRQVAAGSRLTLSPRRSSDRFGRIVRWEWDIGNTGRFVPASGADTAFTAPAADAGFRCALRVTDDDGRTAVATLAVPIVPAGQWAKASDGFPLTSMNWNFQTAGAGLGKIWLVTDTLTSDDKQILLSSSDLERWESVPASTPWRNRGTLSRFFEFRGRMWLFVYDFNSINVEIWSSADGAAWDSVATPAEFRFRQSFATAVFNGRMWVIAGWDHFGEDRLADIWSSADGVTWELTTAQAPFGPRAGLQAAVLGDRLWIYGGVDEGGRLLNDLWHTADGVTWTRTGSAPAARFPYHPVFLSHADRLWFIDSGWDGQVSTAAAWKSADGIAWSKNPDPPGFAPTNGCMILELHGRLWMFGGVDESNSQSGVWSGP